MCTALITGITGQDGALLTEHLLHLGFTVHGIFRRGDPSKLWRLNELDLTDKISLHECDLHNQFHLASLLNNLKPDYIFHFASPSFVADSFHNPSVSINEIVQTSLNILETFRFLNSDAWLFMAGSSEIYSGLDTSSVTETSCPMPLSPYGVAKAAVHSLCRIYRDNHRLNICHGILFNHESEFRSRNFVTRKTTYNIARLALDPTSPPLTLGNLDSLRDWSSARDFIVTIASLARGKCIGDFVIGSGYRTSLREFVLTTSKLAGFDPVCTGNGLDEKIHDALSGRLLVQVSPQYFRPYDTPGNIANTTKLHQTLKRVPTSSISELASSMIRSDIKRLSHD